MKIAGAVSLVTGANGGLGQAYIEALLAAGAAKVYAAARRPDSVVVSAPGRVVPIALDVTDERSVAAAAAVATDVTLVINNAGVALNYGGFVTAGNTAAARQEMEVNYFGTWWVSRAFAPVLKANSGGAFANVLSILALVTAPIIGTYSASKAAALALTRSLRAELAAQGTQVIAVLPGTIDTPMSKDYPDPKVSVAEVAALTLRAIEEGISKVYPGEQASRLAEQLLSDPKAVEKQMSSLLPTA